jgi:hypothetical protein
VWLIDNGVDPDAIVWVRPRDPWMQNRALIQPDPALFIGTAAATMEAAAVATSPDDLFLRLEEIGAMLRIDRTVTPTMAKTPTLAQWELDRLRTIENVVRHGHVNRVEPGRLMLENGDVPIAHDAVVVHCAAAGLRLRPSVPIWGASGITLQTVRAGFPCFGAALIGYVEATVTDDAEKNRLCPPSPYPDTTLSWTLMQLLGARGAMAFGSEPHVREWANTVALNPARVTPEAASSPAVSAAIERFQRAVPAGLEGMARLTA